MADKLKVGIVGCGAVAKERHMPALKRLKSKAMVQAVCDRDQNLAAKIGKEYEVSGIYTELSEMLTKESLDIVDVCVPPKVHRAVAIEAMGHGCHVLLEKPMAPTTEECDEMIRASKESGVKLGIIHNQLFSPPMLAARKLVREGAIGKFTGMRILSSDPRDEMLMRKDYWIHKLPGGMIGETGPHLIYKAIAFIGSVESVNVIARNSFDHPWTPFDEYRIELEGQEASCSILVSYSSNRRASTIDLLGTDGALHVDLVSMLLTRYDSLKSMNPIMLALPPLKMSARVIGGIVRNAFSVLKDKGKFFGHNVVIEEFINSVLSDKEPPVTAEEGRETIRVLEAVVAKLKQKYGI